MGNKLKNSGAVANDKRTRTAFLVIIILFSLLLYGNTLSNRYSADDYIIIKQSGQVLENGIQSVGDFFSMAYFSEGSAESLEKEAGYRPLVRIFYALEYSILSVFGTDPLQDPIAAAKAAHFINILLFLTLVLILYRFLRRIFIDYSPWFPFVIILLFIAHPVHTEVVASLKYQDELLSMIFSILALQTLLKYHDKNKIVYLIMGLLLYVLAFLSSSTALAFWLVFPLCFYFFTDMKQKKIAIITSLIALIGIIGGIIPFWLLDRIGDFSMIENPLYFENNIWYILGTGMYSLGYYLKILLIPHPLLFYYGYDMVPLVKLGNIWVILSILGYTGMLAIAIWKFREKHVISFAILFYLVTIAMFSNILRPVPGIIAENYLLAPSLGFAIALAWLIFKLFKARPESIENKGSRIFFTALLTLLILIPYSYKTYNRNQNWNSDNSIHSTDMKYLDNSVKAHEIMGTAMKKRIEIELSKKVNVAKFLMPDINRALGHFQRAVEIWPGHTASWINMGLIYSNPRISEHLAAKKDTAEFMAFKQNAFLSFNKALEIEPDNGEALFNVGMFYEGMGVVDSAIFYYEECIRFNPEIINPRSRLANIFFMNGNMKRAIELQNEIIQIDPMEALPYVSFGNYFMMKGDTLKAVENYEEAAIRNARPEVYAFLSQYYMDQGDMSKAEKYREQYNKAISP